MEEIIDYEIIGTPPCAYIIFFVYEFYSNDLGSLLCLEDFYGDFYCFLKGYSFSTHQSDILGYEDESDDDVDEDIRFVRKYGFWLDYVEGRYNAQWVIGDRIDSRYCKKDVGYWVPKKDYKSDFIDRFLIPDISYIRRFLEERLEEDLLYYNDIWNGDVYNATCYAAKIKLDEEKRPIEDFEKYDAFLYVDETSLVYEHEKMDYQKKKLNEIIFICKKKYPFCFQLSYLDKEPVEVSFMKKDMSVFNRRMMLQEMDYLGGF